MFAGFETKDSILQLDNESELEKVFQFVRDNIEIGDDERAELLGKFAKHPSKATILPGLNPVMKKIVDAVRSSKRSINTFDQKKNKKRNFSKASAAQCENETSVTLRGKMLSWLYKQSTAKESGQKIRVSIETTSDGSLAFIFQCLICKEKVVVMQRKEGSVRMIKGISPKTVGFSQKKP